MAHAHIVIGADGTVLATAGPVPEGLVDRRLEDCSRLRREVRDTGLALFRRLWASSNRVVSEILAPDDRGDVMELIAVEALALRRAATDLAGLLSRNCR